LTPSGLAGGRNLDSDRRDSFSKSGYALSMPPSGGMGIFGALIMPLAILAMLLRDRGPVSKFLKAGATSPETARKPRSLEITNPDLYSGAIRRRILVSAGDGRYWVDVVALKRSRRRLIIIAAVLFVVITVIATYTAVR
jgi:hypothetical protein